MTIELTVILTSAAVLLVAAGYMLTMLRTVVQSAGHRGPL
jgi:hypothetical protein